MINHLLYLDDLKLYCRNQQGIQSLVTTVKMFSDDICMKCTCGLDKYASLSIRGGKVKAVVTPQFEGMLPLSEGTGYKYLGTYIGG